MNLSSKYPSDWDGHRGLALAKAIVETLNLIDQPELEEKLAAVYQQTRVRPEDLIRQVITSGVAAVAAHIEANEGTLMWPLKLEVVGGEWRVNPALYPDMSAAQRRAAELGVHRRREALQTLHVELASSHPIKPPTKKRR